MLKPEKANADYAAEEAEQATVWADTAESDRDFRSQQKIAMSCPLEDWLGQFRDQWRVQKQPPRVDTFLNRAVAEGSLETPQQRRRLLEELIALDLEYRWKDIGVTLVSNATMREPQESAGLPALQDYAQLLQSQFGPVGQWPLELLAREYRIRHEFGDPVSAEEYARQYPDRPELLARLQEVDLELASAAKAHALAGVVLRGDYELIREIARGGMGVVYQAWQRSLKRTVAVKMILAGQLASEGAIRRFYSEAQAAARLHHAHIVPVFEVGCDGNQHFFAMGYVDGESLSIRVARQGPLPPKEAAALVQRIAEAVEYAHREAVVHRDIKPQNVLLAKDGRPLVTDFGLAKHLDASDSPTITGQVVGTPSFMSPEQAQSRLKEIGPLSDVYSLGAVLYFVLTGRPPFQTASMVETLKQVVEREPVALRSLNPEVSRDLETICLKCLQKNPARRYTSAQQLADDLGRFLAGKEILARPISPLEKGARWCWRNPSTAALIALAALLMFVGWPLIARHQAQLAASQAQAESERQAAQAARERAATQEYYATLHEARQIISRGKPGWRQSALAKLRHGANLDTPARDLVELRSEAAVCLCGIDVTPHLEVAEGMQAAQLAFSADGAWLAVGEFKTQWLGLACEVRIVDAETGRSLHDLSYVGLPLFNKGNLVQDGCRQMAFSPDRRWLVVGARSGHLHVWDLQASPPVHATRRAHEKEIISLVFSPDSRFLYTAAEHDKAVKAWTTDEAGWQEHCRVETEQGVSQLSLESEGQRLLLDERTGAACFADLETLQPCDRRMLAGRGDLISGPWAGTLLMGSQRGLELFDCGTSRCVRVYSDLENLGRNLGSLCHAEFSRDGRLLLAVTTDDRTATLWNTADGKRVFSTVLHPEVPTAAKLSPDGRRLALVGNRRVELLNVDSGIARPMLTSQPAFPQTIAWWPGHELPSVGLPWSLLAEGDSAVAVSSEDRAVMAVDARTQRTAIGQWDGVVDVWDFAVDPPKRLTRVELPEMKTIGFSSDGRRLWVVSEGVNVWSWSNGDEQPRRRFDNRVENALSGHSGFISLAAGRDFVVLGGRQGDLLYAADQITEPRHWRLKTGPITSVAIGPQEDVVACGTEDGHVRVFQAPEGVPLAEWTPHDALVGSVDFSADGRLLASASHDSSVRLWQRMGKSWEPLVTLQFSSAVLQARFHPRQTKLAIQLQGELAVRVLDLSALKTSLDEINLGWSID